MAYNETLWWYGKDNWRFRNCISAYVLYTMSLNELTQLDCSYASNNLM